MNIDTLNALYLRQRDEAEVRAMPGLLAGYIQSDTSVSNQAAVNIQRAWKRFQRQRMWEHLMRFGSSATQIQRIARGYVTRKLIRYWMRTRLDLVIRAQVSPSSSLNWKMKSHSHFILIQSAVRGVISRIRWRRRKKEEFLAALDIQRVFRG